MKGSTKSARALLIVATAALMVGAGVVVALSPTGGIHAVPKSGAIVSWNPAPAARYHAPLSAIGMVGLTGATPVDRGAQSVFQTALGGGAGSIDVNATRFISDQSYTPQSETTLAIGNVSGTTYVLTGVNDARWFFCGALPASACPSGYTISISGFSLGTISSGQPSLVMSDNIPGLLYTSTVNPRYQGFLVSWGDPSVAFGPNGQFYFASLAIDPATGNNGIELAESTSQLFSNSSSCMIPATAPWSNPCWDATLVYGNLSGFMNGHVGSHAPTSFEDKELIAVDNDASSVYFGDVYVAWDHFYASGISSTYLARCTPALHCTMLSGGAHSALSAGSPFVAISTPAVSPDGSVHISWCNYGTPTTLGPITCYVASSAARAKDVGTPVAILSFEGAGTTFPNATGIVGYSTEQFRTDSIPVIAVDGGSGATAGNLYFTIAACTGGSFDNFYAPALPGNSNSSSVLFAASTDGGATWSTPASIAPDGVVNAQPWVSVDNSNGAVIVTYYTSAYDSFNHRLDVQAAVSTDAGATWSWVRVTNVSDEPNADPVLFNYNAQFGGAFVVPQFGDYFQAVGIDGTIWTAFSGNYATELGTFQTDPFLGSAAE